MSLLLSEGHLILEPESPTKQSVRIGKSWITVTVQVNVSGIQKQGSTPASDDE